MLGLGRVEGREGREGVMKGVRTGQVEGREGGEGIMKGVRTR